MPNMHNIITAHNAVNDTPASVDPAEIKFLDSLNNALNEDEQTG